MNLEYCKDEFNKAIDFLKNDIIGLRTGRASVAMVEDVLVEAYGTKQPLKATASINLADAKTLNIEPWDKSLLSNVEKAIRDSALGVNPVNDGHFIRVVLPDLTTERRAELLKVLHQKIEHARISIRKIREEVKDKIIESERNKEIGEDERFKLQEYLEEIMKDYNEKIKEVGEKKEEEINTI
jgi:ribosome recycling factor